MAVDSLFTSYSPYRLSIIPIFSFHSGGYYKTIHLYGKLGHIKEVKSFFYKKERPGNGHESNEPGRVI